MTDPYNLAAVAWSTCVVCQRRRAEQPMVCETDRASLRGDLDDIVTLYARLPSILQPGASAGPNVSGTRTPPLPIRVDVLDFTLPARPASRSLLARGALGLDPDQGGTLSAATVLFGVAQTWADELGHHLPTPDVATLAAWLADRLDWACDTHEAIDEDARDLRELRRDLRRILGEAGPADGSFVVGRCPIVSAETGRPCRTQLIAFPGVTVIECSGCYSRWPRELWLWLASLVRTA